MTTANKLDEFKPRLPVPVNEAVLVYYSGKPPKASERQFQGKTIREATFWLGIADANYPDLVGQYHPLIRSAWISPPRTIEKNGEKTPVKASGLYKLLQAIASDEKANELAYRDASITENAIQAQTDVAEREELQARFIHPDHWKALKGFYVAIFKEPRKDKETGQVILAENGGIFWQEVAELRPLKFGRIFNEEQLQASIIWPPPKPEPKPLGLPHAAQAKPQDPAPPEGPPPEAKDAAPARQSEPEPKTDEQVLAELAKLYQSSDEYRAVIMAVLRDNNVTKGAALKPEERRRLYAICLCVKEWVQAPDLKAKGQALLQQVNTPIHKLTAEQATNLQRDLVAPF